MNKIKSILYFTTISLFFIVMNSCKDPGYIKIKSPNGNFRFELELENSQPFYRVYFDNNEIIGLSSLGFILSDSDMVPSKVKIKSIEKTEINNDWKPIYGEKSHYPDQYRQVVVSFNSLVDDLPIFKLNIRAYNEGVAFRYEFENSEKTIIEDELTEFSLPKESELWVSSSAQGMISKIKIAELSTTRSVERPLLAQLNDSLFVSIGEAALVDYSRMKFLLHKEKSNTLISSLDSKVVFDGPFNSPWRVIMAGNSAGQLLENNYLLLNLNEPNKIANTGWIKPGKVIREVTLTTKGGMACVDFAYKHNIEYIEFDAGWYGNEYDEKSDATTVTVDPKRSKGPLELQQIIKYAESKGIGVILYVNRRSLEKQLDDVLPLLKSWGVKGVKFGFVNVGSQYWTNWLHEAVRKAAKYELMVDVHDEYRPTGYSRTYPNLMTQEGIRGDEASPDNTMVLKTLFVRMLAGAGDHTNCYFADRVDDKLGSHASQLAKTICIYSPWQFIYWYDRPNNSSKNIGGAGGSESYITEVPELTFFDQLPTTWDDTKIIEGYPGEFAVVARKSGTTWFVAALNGKEQRDFSIALDFLDPSCNYEATLFRDDKQVETVTKVAIDTMTLSSNDHINHYLKKNEGMALIFKKK